MVTAGSEAGSLNLGLDECCAATVRQNLQGFTWIPPEKAAPATTTAAGSAGSAPCLLAGACRWHVAPPPPPFVFAKQPYHVITRTQRDSFPVREVLIIDGTIPPAGGEVSLHDANGTYADTTIAFSAAVEPLASPPGTALSGPISTIWTVLSWIRVGTHMCGALPSPVCA